MNLLEKDKTYVWHPYRQAQATFDSILITRGKGSYLYNQEGNAYLDAISSWWVNLHGHTHPYIAKRIADQAQILEQVIFAECTHPLAVELAERLITLIPHMGKVFYSDNGSTAVEVALKMALQYWHNQALSSSKNKIICFNQAYHGETFGAMSAAGKHLIHRPFWPFLFEVEKIDPPFSGNEEKSLLQLEKILNKGHGAAFIFEPLIQGASGMRRHSAAGLNILLKRCHEEGLITIADEVMTGFGRTGPLFAIDQLNEKPDIMCLSKGLTGGFLPLGATLCRQSIHDQFLSDRLETALLHAHSYTANPLACAAALASLDLLLKDECAQQRALIEEQHQRFKAQCQGHPRLSRCEVSGTILALEYRNKEPSFFSPLRDRLSQFFLSRNILLRPLGPVIYAMPPYCTSVEDLEKIYDSISITLRSEQW